MLFSLKDIQNYRLEVDGVEPGKIKSFLVDSFDWVVRYAIVEIANRNMLLSVRALGQPDLRDGKIRVNIDREELLNSPLIDVDQPLSREHERELYDYFGWRYYWEPDDVPNSLPGDLTAIPLINMELDRERQEEEEERELIPQTGMEDSGNRVREYNLHNTKELFGNTIHTTNDDNNAGKLVDIISQDEDWNVMYLVVDTGGLLPGKKVLVSPSWVQQIDENSSSIDVNLKEETIKSSPEFNSYLDLTEEYQARLRNYYQ